MIITSAANPRVKEIRKLRDQHLSRFIAPEIAVLEVKGCITQRVFPHHGIDHGRGNIIQAHAEKQGESVNAFINRAIWEAIERDNASSKGGPSLD